MIRFSGPTMPKKYKKAFDEKRKADNYTKLLILGVAMFLIQIFAIVQNTIEPFTDNVAISSRYLLFYYVMTSLNLIIMLLMIFIKKKSLSKLKVFTLLMILHIVVINVWGMGVAIADQFQGQDVVVYYLTMIFIAILINVSALEITSVLVSVYIMFLVLTPFYSEYLEGQSQVLLTSLQFILFSIVIRYYLEKLTSQNFIQHMKLLDTNDELERLSYFDPLSTLYNRRKWELNYVDMYKECFENEMNLSVILFDIDYFKQYNDFYGHVKGDEIIRIFSNVLLELSSELNCNVGRYGGDEFIISIVNASENQVYKLIKDMKEEIRAKNIENKESKINGQLTISAGVYFGIPESNQDVWDFVVKADKNLYFQKDNR